MRGRFGYDVGPFSMEIAPPMNIAAAKLKSIADLDGPRGWPLLGNLPQIELSKLHQHLERWCDEYGPIYKFRMGPETIVCIADSDVINKMLRDRPGGFRRQRQVESVISEMGFNGVFSSEGESWKRQRKVVALALNSAHIKQFFPKLLETTARLQRRWEAAADAGLSIDLCRDVMRYTVDVTTQLAFGINVNTLETEGPVIQQQLDKVFPALGRRINAVFPYWRYFRLAEDRKIDHALSEIRKTVNGFIADCRARMRDDPSLYESPNNFLEAIIAAQTAEAGTNFTDDEVFANVLTLLLAGEDTTANTIAWTAKHLIDFPAYFARARAEVDTVVAPDSGITEQSQLTQIPFTEACASETMRLKPVAPFFPMEANEDVELMGYHIPAGTLVIGLSRQVALSTENFGAPQRFAPERWLEDHPADTAPHNTQAFMPFGGGPRFCPGRNLALVEIKMVLAMLVRNFDIAFSNPDEPVEERLSFAMIPTHLHVKFSRRKPLT